MKRKSNKGQPPLASKKVVAGGATGVLLGAVVGGPVGALLGGVIGTALGKADEHGKKANSPASRSVASARAATPKRPRKPRVQPKSGYKRASSKRVARPTKTATKRDSTGG